MERKQRTEHQGEGKNESTQPSVFGTRGQCHQARLDTGMEDRVDKDAIFTFVFLSKALEAGPLKGKGGHLAI